MWLEKLPVGTLLKAALRRVKRKGLRRLGLPGTLERSVMYNGVVVFDNTDLDGGGWTHGQDFIRMLLKLGIGRCRHICEFGAGPGYIGYLLLAHGFCERLTLIDINPDAVRMATKTARYNQLDAVVGVYESDCFDQVPAHEKWDIVVSNPPQFVPVGGTRPDEWTSPRRSHVAPNPARAFDPGWRIHERFFQQVGAFIKPGGVVLFQECALPLHPRSLYLSLGHQRVFVPDIGSEGHYKICLDCFEPYHEDRLGDGSTPEVFAKMVERNGGEYLGWSPATNLVGQHDGMYYVISRWN